MKPNDKAIDAGFEASAISVNGSVFGRVSRSTMKEILEAAYAAQFQSEEYADVIKSLRVMHDSIITDAKEQFRDGIHETMPSKAADALEAVLAERDALKAGNNELREENENLKAANRYGKDWVDNASQDIASLRAERDALAARLAPVDDEALVEIAVRTIHKEAEKGPVFGGNLIPAVIAAIRPHIEAAERERCAKAVETVGEKINVAHHERPEWEDGYLQGVHDAAAAIRSGSGSVK